MPEKENKAAITAFVEEVMNRKDVSAMDRLCAPDFAYHDVADLGHTHGRDVVKGYLAKQLAAFPDMHQSIDDLLADGERIALRYTCRGSHKGEFMGVTATGRSVTFAGLYIVRFANGKMAEWWQAWDSAGLMKQIGATPKA